MSNNQMIRFYLDDVNVLVTSAQMPCVGCLIISVFVYVYLIMFVFQRPNTTLWVSSGQPLHLIVSLSEDGVAKGDLYWDDGEILDTYEKNQYAYIYFTVEQVQKKALFAFTAINWHALVFSKH